MPTTRSRRRWICGKCETGRSRCPITNICQTYRVSGEVCTVIERQINAETLVEVEHELQNMMTERLDTGHANFMNLRPKTLKGGGIAASRSFIQKSLIVTVRKRVPKRRPGTTRRRNPSQKKNYQNDPKNHLGRKKRKRRKMRKESVRKPRVRAAAMIAVMKKTSGRGKGLKVDRKAEKAQKTEGGMRTAAQETVMMRKKVRLTAIRNANRAPTKIQTQGHTQKRRGKTGKQQVRRARAIVLQTETNRHGHKNSSGKDHEKYSRFFCLP